MIQTNLRHIQKHPKLSFCGRNIQGFMFVDKTHAVSTTDRVCKMCAIN